MAWLDKNPTIERLELDGFDKEDCMEMIKKYPSLTAVIFRSPDDSLINLLLAEEEEEPSTTETEEIEESADEKEKEAS